MAEFKAALAADAAAITDFLVPKLAVPQRGILGEAMAYAVQGGKMLRGFFVLETARLHGVSPDGAMHAAGAIECVHAYSLVHDDLPCMDDDDLRRGQPTVHRRWDEAIAVLAGDALQAQAFALIGTADLSDAVQAQLMVSLADRGGADGMVGGQVADIAAESAGGALTLDEITALQAGKTGALLIWSTMAGAVMAEADAAPLRRYGEAIGLAFQIADDVLDVEGDEAAVGKAVRKDDAAGKATFVSLLGLDGAKRRAAELVDEACDALNGYGDAAATLKDAARFVIERSH
ncbi:polyprenyl synthetase family protein [Pseudooctadecabacter jejudonensis]|nr:farnesyl diphosphate synthase [Pseudooctadecabacter jejudonensis]